MSSLYIHIPFCKQACYYCDFHFSTNLKLKNEIIASICKEIQLQKNYLTDTHLQSIYFGGGTPSLLSIIEINTIFDCINQFFTFDKNTEITLEGNPDDLTPSKLKVINQSPINRLSIGVQTFNNEKLKFLNRAHNNNEALVSIKEAQDIGLDNITIDLIYGIPDDNHNAWHNDLEIAKELDIKHLSAYSLTIEPKTVFGNWEKKKKISIDDDFCAVQFEYLLAFTKDNHYLHYEISNFCQEGYYSKHNSNYWTKGDYLGIGPSAHSYNFHSRQYNINNNAQYIKKLTKNIIPAEVEILSPTDQSNEYIMTSLRTMWGTNLPQIEKISQTPFYEIQKNIINQYIASGDLILKDKTLFLSDTGKLLADKITSDLFLL